MCDLESYVTDMQWFPGASKSNAAGNDVFVVSCSDGTFKIVGRNGRVEKSVEAHRGAAISLRWGCTSLMQFTHSSKPPVFNPGEPYM